VLIDVIFHHALLASAAAAAAAACFNHDLQITRDPCLIHLHTLTAENEHCIKSSCETSVYLYYVLYFGSSSDNASS